ncbi:amino acid ABC transporter permease [Agromyces intestinalis]|uniref:Amino acid ABC transporter permease n=1 Tax=Agromyces intestinalis TaxID=2592652 RepID=A0A5C1YDI1_9MICO|nr:amino acid ABC transporter permease [Agromyces intestinalis]QEO13475.1 amino acid ABC transporter permease [Agromyces intestinalis]
MTAPATIPATGPSDIELARRAYRRRQTGRSVLVSAASTLVFAVVVIGVVLLSPGWSRVQQTFFDWDVAVASFPRIIAGLWLNLQVLVFSAIGVAVVGLLLATLRTLRGPVFFPLRALAAGYTDLFRGVPLIIMLYLIGFGVPALDFFPRVPLAVWGTVAIVIVYSAYVSEVLRAGFEAVHPSQRLAARALGLTHGQTMRRIVVPQGLRKVTPALMNDFVAMQKDVGLISVLGAVDAVRGAQIEVAHFFNYTPYVVAGLLFVLLAWPTIRVTDWLTARMRDREQVGSLV